MNMLPSLFSPSLHKDLDCFFDRSWDKPKIPRTLMNTNIYLNVLEEKDKYLVEVTVPGVEKENIDLSLDKNTLAISARYEKDSENKYLINEIPIWSCSRKVVFPKAIEEDNIRASTSNGILTIEVPKLPSSIPKKIQIK